MKPIAQTAHMLVQELENETVVYDRKRHRAHCLHSTAAALWKCCDGETEAGAIDGRLRSEFGVTVESEVIETALNQLLKARLIEPGSVDPAKLPVVAGPEAARNLAILDAAPLVASIDVPSAADAPSTEGVRRNGGSKRGRGRRRARRH